MSCRVVYNIEGLGQKRLVDPVDEQRFMIMCMCY